MQLHIINDTWEEEGVTLCPVIKRTKRNKYRALLKTNTEKEHITYIKNKIWSYNIVYKLLTSSVNNNVLLRKVFNNNGPSIFSYLTGYDYNVLNQIKLMYYRDINLIKEETAKLKIKSDAAKNYGCCCFYEDIDIYNKRISIVANIIQEYHLCNVCYCCRSRWYG